MAAPGGEAGGEAGGPREEPAALPARAWWDRLRDSPGALIPLIPAAAARPPRSSQGPPQSGILNIDKPAGMTSHDLVAALRKASGERRVGHAGTLDPMATGVLLLCLGSATRVVEDLQAFPKTYQARLRLGLRTASGDAEGALIATRDPSAVTRTQVEAALDAFRGDILQTPPMVSALRHEGQRLYALARAGIEVERAPRPVTVHALELVDWAPPELALEMRVSKGTYVRAIADDLGEALGVGAHLVALRRSAVGAFRVEDAEPLELALAAFAEGWWPEILHPLDAALVAYDAMLVDPDREAALRQGQQIEGQAPGPGASAEVRVYDGEGRFVGLVAWDAVSARWQPRRVFPPAS